MEEKLFNFVYITTNLISGMQYVGEYSSNNFNSYKSKNHLGSGKYLIHAIKKYGRKNFRREILEFFSTKKKAFDTQAPLIIKYNTLSPIGYNLSPTGGLCVMNCFTNETRLKMSLASKGKPKSLKQREKCRLVNLGRKHSEETKRKISESHIGKKQSEITIQKRVNKNRGKKRSEEIKQKMKLSQLGEKNNHYGKHCTEETKLKISNIHKGKPKSEEHKNKIRLSILNKKINVL